MQTRIHVNPKHRDLEPQAFFLTKGDHGSADIKGRGSVVFFCLKGSGFVRKNYQRGGWIRKLIHNQYAYTGYSRTRMAREYHLLESLHKLGLPVPEPVAIRVIRQSPFTYSGDLVTARLEGSNSMGSLLRRHPLPAETWARIGSTIGRFHGHSVHHADLNIENILLDDEARIHLLDFDKGRFQRSFRSFLIRKSLKRLRRSIDKGAARSERFHFTEDDWSILIAHHQKALSDPSVC
jgi:3-deoxy-D-manno-octulosonic acid kinase